MRSLCSIHIFREVQPNIFANNTISAALLDNEPLRAYIVMLFVFPFPYLPWKLKLTSSSSWDLYTASDALPKALLAPESKDSYAVTNTAFQRAVGTTKERWVWLEEGSTPAELQRGCSRTGIYSGPFGPDVAQKVGHKRPDEQVRRPELDIFGLAMLGGGMVFGTAHLYGLLHKTISLTKVLGADFCPDFPWQTLGDAQLVDVGGGVGQ